MNLCSLDELFLVYVCMTQTFIFKFGGRLSTATTRTSN